MRHLPGGSGHGIAVLKHLKAGDHAIGDREHDGEIGFDRSSVRFQRRG